MVFGFSIPRSAAPLPVFDAMVRAVEYCRHRMGGTIRADNGEPADIGALRSDVEAVDQELRRRGFAPGSDAALRTF